MSASRYYTLIGQTPSPCDDLLEWARWMRDSQNGRVRLTRVGPYFVSTVFLGLDLSVGWPDWSISRAPILFETMVWIEDPHEVKFPAHAGSPARTLELDRSFLDLQERCATWLEAESQHERVIREIKQAYDDVEEIGAHDFETRSILKKSLDGGG